MRYIDDENFDEIKFNEEYKHVFGVYYYEDVEENGIDEERVTLIRRRLGWE